MKRYAHGVCLLVVALAAAAPGSGQEAGDAYLDEPARELVRLARLRRGTVDRRIEAYQTTARERFTVSLRAGVVEKLMYRRETATRIEWERDGAVRMAVLGMREFAPIANPAATVPTDISAELPGLAFDPANLNMLIRIDTTEILNPLRADGEKDYRFATGDTTVITLPDGRRVRLRELRVIPRRRSPLLLSGSMWLEAETHAVVQVQMTLARGIRDSDVTVSADSGGFLAAFVVKQLLGLVRPIRFDVDFVALDYGLWDLHWWLPRAAVARGVAQAGRFRIPIAYERTYADYTVRGDASGAVLPRSDSIRVPCRPTVRFVTPGDATGSDSVRQARTDSEAARRKRAQGERAPTVPCPREFIVAAPSDSLLVHSPELPADLYSGEFELVGEADLGDVIARVRSLTQPPWHFRQPVIQWGLAGGMSRYNRVEGASTGARVLLEVGPLLVRPELRYGFADGQVRGELGVERTGAALEWQLAAYRRLRSASPSPHVHGTGTSLGALVFGRDEDEYFDARGAELVLRPAPTRRQWYEAELFAERQGAVARHARFSIARVFDSDREFRPNFTAAAADQIGVRVALRHSLGTFPARPRIDGAVTIGAETGDCRFLRREALLRGLLPLPRGLSVVLEGAAGTMDGAALPAQALWRLGGTQTLRGYPTGSLVGEQFWRGRGELGVGVGAMTLSVFADAAKAGRRADFGSSDVLRSYGIGVTQLSGLVRVDLARGIDAGGKWRLHLQVNRDF